MDFRPEDCFLRKNGVDSQIGNVQVRPMTEKEIPRLRTDIDIIPTVYRGEKVFLVKDSLGLIPDPVLLRGEALQVIGLIDGKRDVREIQLEMMRRKGGVFIRIEDVAGMLSELDAVFMIDSDSYRERKTAIIREYSRQSVRNPVLAGKSYPEKPDSLTSYIESILKTGEGTSDRLEGKEVLALVAPHIDLEVGKKIYARAYKAIKNALPHIVLLLGTGHNLQESYLSLTKKDFLTPRGRIRTDRQWVKRLIKSGGPDVVSPHDLDHRNEHALEFQLLFLHHLFGDGFTLVPVLCGSFQRVLQEVSRPAEIPGMEGFLSELKYLIEEESESLLVVAGVDFSHIGPKFGHRRTASSLLWEAKDHDKSLLEKIGQGDVGGFWHEVQKVNNKYNVCGFSSLAVLLELFEGKEGQVLGYDFWKEEPTQSAVSFAAVAFPRS
jgi:AmmeMemoRadiSam system protein B